MRVTLIDFNILSGNEILLLGLLLACFFFQLFVVLFVYLKLAVVKSKDDQIIANPITSIMIVRNEEDRIREMIEQLFSQKYSENYIRVIDNFSQDNTPDVLETLKKEIPKLKSTGLSQETRFPEKLAINLGLKGAASLWINFIDPNFSQMNDERLLKFNKYIDEDTDAVIAYENEDCGEGVLRYVFRIERFVQFLWSGSYSLAGIPLVFNEHNVLFRKSLYFDVEGFKQRLDKSFANLELIFNEHLSKGRVKVTLEPEMVVRNRSEEITRTDFIGQLKKYVLVRKDLQFRKRLVLIVDDYSRLLLFVFAGVLIILSPANWLMFTIPVFIYFLLLLIIVKKILRRLNERKIFLPSLMYLLIKPLINLWLTGSMYLIQRRSKWN